MALLAECGEFVFRHNPAISEKLKPVRSFLQFLQRITALRSELGFATRSIGFAIIRADRSS